MVVIKKITVKYSPDEDRLSLATETAQGEVLILWVTARIAVRLVDCLVRKLEQTAAPQVTTTAPHDTETRARQQAIQQWEQSAANLAKKPSTEVKMQSATSEKLIRAVDVGSAGERHVLIFRWGDKEGAQMIFTPVEMRQWLQIVHATFKQAGWSMAVWPDWYDQPQAPPPKTDPVCLH